MAAIAAVLQIVEQVVVIVNGDLLTRTQIDDRVRRILAQEQGRIVTAADVRADPLLQQHAAALTPGLVAGAIDELLVLQRAREQGFNADSGDVDRVLARMRLENHATTDEGFAALLRSQGIPADALRDSVRDQILIAQVRDDVFRRITVSDDDARAYYRLQPAEFAAGPALTFLEIRVGMPPADGPPLSVAAAREHDEGLIRIVRAQERIRAGEDFGAVARAVSDAPSREGGGLAGPVDPRTLPAALAVALANLRPGGVSGPIRTGDAYWILQLQSVEPSRPATFEAWRDRVIAVLLERRRAAAFRAHLVQLRARALMQWKDHALQAAVEAGRTREQP
jgi:peptidyl-prolyl cis-trans isomerase SurA